MVTGRWWALGHLCEMQGQCPAWGPQSWLHWACMTSPVPTQSLPPPTSPPALWLQPAETEGFLLVCSLLSFTESLDLTPHLLKWGVWHCSPRPHSRHIPPAWKDVEGRANKMCQVCTHTLDREKTDELCGI